VPKRPAKKGQVKVEKYINTLLIDGNALFKVGYHGAINEVNWKGEKIGGIYQFITVLRKLLLEDLYHKVYVFWDGPLSGKLRYEIYSDYKVRRKCFVTGKRVTEIDPWFIKQQIAVKNYIEELSIRQFEDEVVEGDDLIAYYCLHKKPNEKITVCTNDRDITQVLEKDVRVYLCDKKIFLTTENYSDYFSNHYSNVLLIKTITGDASDDIKGVKGLGEKGLLNYFPEIKERPVTLSEILEKAAKLQSERIENKKKPLQSIQNLIEGRTDGIQGSNILAINEVIIDLKNPLLTEGCKTVMDEYMESSINPEGRDIKNVYQYIKRDGLSRLIGTNNLADYLLPFKKLMSREESYFINN